MNEYQRINNDVRLETFIIKRIGYMTLITTWKSESYQNDPPGDIFFAM